jgi:(1->4)-alpha-D-glucan 1-alpha-D-glucosylmutase
MREAATSTQWTAPNPPFESAVHKLVDAAYDDSAVHEPLARFVERIAPYGWSNAIGQKLVQLTMPGVPDVYQGTELWEDSLVDPDNRRPVDFAAQRFLLAALEESAEPPPLGPDGAAKLWVTSRVLRLRRDRPELLTGYTPLWADGPANAHVVAFDRGGAVSVATRLPVTLERDGGWRDTVLDVGGAATDVLTGQSVGGTVPLADLLATYPVALLVRD